MQIEPNQIADFNKSYLKDHENDFAFLSDKLTKTGADVEGILQAIADFQVAIPSWALGTGGTRFGRFPGGGEPRTLEEKIDDVGIIHALNQSSGAISLHIPWDVPEDASAIKQQAVANNLVFDAVNSNTFQDQEGQKFSYKFGSLCHVDKAVRDQAVTHNKDVIDHGVTLGSKSLTVWLADGSTFPGQHHFKSALANTIDSLKEIYAYLPDDWEIFIEYKPYEPNFYSMVIPDWGTSHLIASKLGEKATCLVDLGHHLPNTNIEQIVAILRMQGKLGGFHFNDSKYGDDDLTVGSLKPYQLFLIFNELLDEKGNSPSQKSTPAWMIDASHNLKDPLEDLIQSTEAILIALTQALIVDRTKLYEAQGFNDSALAQEILQAAYRTDLRPLIREARIRQNGAINPIDAFRKLNIRKKLVSKRGSTAVSSGL